jgi:hypothetical protein
VSLAELIIGHAALDIEVRLNEILPTLAFLDVMDVDAQTLMPRREQVRV